MGDVAYNTASCEATGRGQLGVIGRPLAARLGRTRRRPLGNRRRIGWAAMSRGFQIVISMALVIPAAVAARNS